MGRSTLILALIAAAPHVTARAQDPWPGALCYELTRGGWASTGRPGSVPRGVDAPDLIVLDSARRGALLGFGDRPDTVGRVVHGLLRDTLASPPTYRGYGGERWFSGWTRPTQDSVTARIGTGHGGVEFRFRVNGSQLIGVVDWWTDYGAGWTARVIGRPTRCPAGPPALGRLRLALVETPGLETEVYLPMSGLDLELSTEETGLCGGWIDYSGIMADTLVAVTLHGLTARRCDDPAARATTTVGATPRPGRHTVLVGHPVGADTNRFVLTVTDSSAQLTTVRSTFVTADERPLRRTPHNLFEVRCGDRAGAALCGEIESWLVGLRGISRPVAFPQRKQIDKDMWVALFRYDSRETLDRVRACVRTIADAVRPTEGISVTIRTWLGEEIGAWSDGRDSRVPLPAGLTTRGGCAR